MKNSKKYNKFALMACIAVLSTGCGSSDDPATADAETEFRQSIVGTWTSGCRDDSAKGNTQQGSIGTFEISMTEFTNSGIEYAETTCDTQIGTWGPDAATMTIGAEFATGDGTMAYEFDITVPDGTFYSSIKLVGDQIFIADETENGGDTAENREKTFDNPATYTKQS